MESFSHPYYYPQNMPSVPLASGDLRQSIGPIPYSPPMIYVVPYDFQPSGWIPTYAPVNQPGPEQLLDNQRQAQAPVVYRTPVDLKELFPTETPAASPAVPVKKTPLPKRNHCKFCRSNREPAEVYTSHELKNSLNETVCPILSKYVCPACGKTGKEAHTMKYCPLAVNVNQTPRIYRKVRNSVGSYRILKY